MSPDQSREFRHLAMEWWMLARRASEPWERAALEFTAQKWLEIATRAEREPYVLSLQRRAIQMAIGNELRNLYGASLDVPPDLVAVLNRLAGETERERGLNN